jgi:hypothetical protein
MMEFGLKQIAVKEGEMGCFFFFYGCRCTGMAQDKTKIVCF